MIASGPSPGRGCLDVWCQEGGNSCWAADQCSRGSRDRIPSVWKQPGQRRHPPGSVETPETQAIKYREASSEGTIVTFSIQVESCLRLTVMSQGAFLISKILPTLRSICDGQGCKRYFLTQVMKSCRGVTNFELAMKQANKHDKDLLNDSDSRRLTPHFSAERDRQCPQLSTMHVLTCSPPYPSKHACTLLAWSNSR